MMFTFASALCGMAWNLPTLILARILQGIGGGAMVPIAQAILLESFPPHKRGAAMAMFAQGVVVAPILGPTLGGWITDNYSWRWIFYINLPVGILARVDGRNGSWKTRLTSSATRRRRLISSGSRLLAVWLATLQIVSGQGTGSGLVRRRNWVRWFTVAFRPSSLIGFIVWEFTVEHPLVDLRVFKNRNFAVGVMLMTSSARFFTARRRNCRCFCKR